MALPDAAQRADQPRTWKEILKTMQINPFGIYETFLINVGCSSDEALDYFSINYEKQVCVYTNETISNLFRLNYYANLKKYQELVSIIETDLNILNPVDLTENYTDIRTPNLQSSSSSNGSAETNTQRKQTRTTTTTPTQYQSETTHQSNPYDNTGFNNVTKDTTVESGSTATTETFTGPPDSTGTISAATTTTTATGNERIEHRLTRSGRDGRFKVSEIIDDAELTAAKLNFLQVLCNDLSDCIFLQMWIF